MKLIFVRHGDPDYVNDTLTERGWKEAEALAPRVAKWQADAFYSSPLGRAKDTAKVSLEPLGETATELSWLREFHVDVKDPATGETTIPWDFLPRLWTKDDTLYDRHRWHESEIMKTGKVAERKQQVCQGIDALLESYGYERKGNLYYTEQGHDKTLVFFCHLGVQFVILSHLLGVSASVLWQNFFVAPTSVTVVETEEREKGIAAFRCRKVGDTSHLYCAGIRPSDSGFYESVYGKERNWTLK